MVRVFLGRTRKLLYSSPNPAGAYSAGIVIVVIVVVHLLLATHILTHTPHKIDAASFTHDAEYRMWLVDIVLAIFVDTSCSPARTSVVQR